MTADPRAARSTVVASSVWTRIPGTGVEVWQSTGRAAYLDEPVFRVRIVRQEGQE